VSSEEQIDEFARNLSEEVKEIVATGSASPYEVKEFARIVLERLGDEGVFDNPIFLMEEGRFGPGRWAISGYSLSDDEDRLLLFATLYRGELPPPKLGVQELRDSAELAARFLWYSAQGLYEKIEPANTDASDLSRRLYELSSRISHLKVVVLTDGRVGTRSFGLRGKDGTEVEVELLGIERLQRILGEGASREDIVVDMEEVGDGPLACLDCGSEGDYRAYLSVIPGACLARIYERYGTRLLELNVRAFLGLRGKKSVNAGLRATLKDEPEHFLAYNNGIVATVDGIDFIDGPDGNSYIRSLRGLQIVNGGQTTASIHRTVRVDKTDRR
jgi:hypothetical protein